MEICRTSQWRLINVFHRDTAVHDMVIDSCVSQLSMTMWWTAVSQLNMSDMTVLMLSYKLKPTPSALLSSLLTLLDCSRCISTPNTVLYNCVYLRSMANCTAVQLLLNKLNGNVLSSLLPSFTFLLTCSNITLFSALQVLQCTRERLKTVQNTVK